MDQWTTDPMAVHMVEMLSCVAGSATLSVLSPILDQVDQLGHHALNRLNSELGNHPNAGNIRGIGLMIGIEFINENSEPNSEAVQYIRNKCIEKGLLLVSWYSWKCYSFNAAINNYIR